LQSGLRVKGYEIHMGRTVLSPKRTEGALEPFLKLHLPGEKRFWQDGWSLDQGRIIGTYLHGLLDSPAWRKDYLNRIRRSKGLAERKTAAPGRGGRFRQYNLLADHFEEHIDVANILNVMGL